VFVQVNVPLGRDPDLDLVKINFCPEELTNMDCLTIERAFRMLLGEETAHDLKVRKYRSARNWFVIIYIGSSQQRTQILREILKNGIKMRKYD